MKKISLKELKVTSFVTVEKINGGNVEAIGVNDYELPFSSRKSLGETCVESLIVMCDCTGPIC